MEDFLKTIRCGINYTFEVIYNAGRFNEYLKGVSDNPQVTKYFINRYYGGSASALMGSSFYDMSVDDEQVLCERNLIGRTASKIILLYDITDNIIDKRPTSLDEKFNFLNNVKSNLFGHATYSSVDFQEEASYSLARSIYKDFLSKYKSFKFEIVFDELIDVIKRQFTEEESEELLEIAKIIGSCVTDSTAVLTEIVTEEDYPEIRYSARKIGEYSELLDHYYEIDNDLDEGVNTYPTIRIWGEGNTQLLRREIKNRMITLANKSFTEGYRNLNERNKRIYKVQKFIIDFKYKVADRLQNK